MKKLLSLLILHMVTSMALGQKNDHIWMFGYGIGTDSLFGITTLDFNVTNDPLVSYRPEISFFFNATDVSMCSPDGELIFYTNGIDIADAAFGLMENGNAITNVTGSGNTLPQGALALPYPNQPSRFYLFHEELVFEPELSIVVFEPEYSVIDMGQNSGLGSVIIKKEAFLIDTLQAGRLQAVRHANGRDWWVLKRVEFTSQYYKMLLSPEGVAVVDTQQVGEPLRTGLGQAVFSPDSRYYVQVNAITLEEGTYIDIYGFDRCTGILHQIKRIHYDEDALAAGAAISPNSRFLYISSYTKFYQYDLWADDIAGSRETVAVYDGFEDPLPTRFFLCQLAPNGKIYVSATNGVSSLHVIDYPDKLGTDCQMQQHGVELPTFNAFSMPNFPNYRLGPLDGSPCDTLGLDNIPVAKFRYEQDTANFLKVEFTDLSYYEPSEWSWDFGDNTSSMDTSLVHIFPASGTYETCLTVTNQYGEDTYCQLLHLGTVATGEVLPEVDIAVFPNPCREMMNVSIHGYLPRNARVVLFDAVGQRHLSQPVRSGWNRVVLDGLTTGIYFYQVWEEDVLLGSGKLVKVE